MIRILDDNLKILETITQYTSVEFVKAFNDYGRFTAQIPLVAAPAHIAINRILKHKNNFGIIKYVLQAEGSIVIKGYDLKYLMAQRVVFGNKNGKGEAIIKDYISDATNTETRKFSCFSVAESEGRGEAQTYTMEKPELLSDVIKKICEKNSWGWDIEVNGKSIIFDITEPSTLNFVYSDRKRNIKSYEYTQDALNEVNAVMCYESDSDGTVTTTMYDKKNKSGIERSEAIIQSSDTTEEECEKLIKESTAENLEAEILDPLDYGDKWKLGDFVKLKVRVLGGEIEMTKQISEVTEVYEANRHIVTPTFGEIKESVFRKIIKERR